MSELEMLALAVAGNLVALEREMSKRRPRVGRMHFEAGLANVRKILELSRRGRR